jgi:hypothetical protein
MLKLFGVAALQLHDAHVRAGEARATLHPRVCCGSRPIGDIPCDYAFRRTPHTPRTRRGEKYETLGLDTAGEAENGEAGTTHFIPASSR